jgi:hypothetical protein
MRLLATAVLVLLASTAGAAPAVYSGSAVERAATGASAKAALQAMAARGDAGGGAGIAAEARRRVAAAGDDAPLAARILHGALMMLASHPPDDEARALIAAARASDPVVYVALDEAGHELVLPAWDPAAAARYVERRWAENAAREATLRSLASRGDAGDWLAAPEPARRGVLEALAVAPTGQVAGILPSVEAALAAGMPGGEAALIVAARSGDPGLFARALRVAPGSAALDALAVRLPAFPAAERIAVLESLLDHAGLASAALLALGREAGTEPAAERTLWTRLADPELGASAALALARLESSGTEARLEALVRDRPDSEAARWARLALSLRSAP